MKRLLLLVLFTFSGLIAGAQKKHFDLNWNGSEEFKTSNTSVTIPAFNSSYMFFEQDKLGFNYHWVDEQPADIASLHTSNIVYEDITSAQLFELDKNQIPADAGFQLHTTKAAGEVHTFLTFYPIIKTGTSFKRIVSLDVTYTYNLSAQKLLDVPAISNSVLATGNWYKFYVQESGVFRINRQFLSNLGINVGQVDPRTIKIYGYGGNMLPLLNGNNEYYDLPELAIQVHGEEDGKFDSSDYILFYATGPHEWNDDSQTNNNLYNDIIYYYITYGGNTGKRIQAAEEPTGNPSQLVTTYDDYQYHETEQYNIVKVGRRWFGEIFNLEPEQTFTFKIENLVTSEPVKLGIKAAAAASVATSMSIKVNNQQVMTYSFGAIDEASTSYASEDTSAGGTNYTRGLKSADVNVSSDNVQVTINYNNGGSPTSLGYLDYITLEGKRQLAGRGEQFPFTLKSAATTSGIAEYDFTNSSNIRQVWDITDLYNVTAYANTDNSTNFNFKVLLGEQRKYMVVDALDYKSPSINSSAKTVANQNLKATIFQDDSGNTSYVDYIILTPEVFKAQAERLAQLHRDYSGLNVKVVTLPTIYNEFNTGNQDIAAIRNFIKYVYDNAPSESQRLKYVCMFGDGSYDYKNITSNNTNFVPLYHSYPSFSLTTSVCSDDFYGMMDAGEGMIEGYDLLDVAVGRMIIDDVSQASAMVDKVAQYISQDAYGRWRNNLLLVSDDVDEYWEREIETSLDALGDSIYENKPFINIEKIHTDSYVQQTTSGGERYPDAKEELLNKLDLGALVVSYFGHGGEDGLASERIFQAQDAINLTNDKLPLFITVTCDFTRFDNPAKSTGGEYTYWNENGGAISLITTTREIYAINGSRYNEIIAKYLYAYGSDEYTSMGEALRRAKVDESFGGLVQKRVVFYIGDPALKLAIPKSKINLTHINGVPVSQVVDTLKALSKVTLKGNVTNVNGALLSGYTGTVYATVYDKNIQRTTLGNDGIVNPSTNQVFKMDFETLGEVLFRGKANVVNGIFEFEFIVPRDALIPVDNGRVSFYAVRNDYSEDQTGYNTDILVGELNENAASDNDAPLITLYMNDENFLYGGMTNQSPVLLAYLSDANGINTSSGIGHDIVAILDGDETNPYVLNDYYETELDVYTKGVVTFPFSDLEPGLHTITFKAWDTYNNSATAEIQFLVIDDDEMKLEKVLNYPNPFVSYTEFWFEHNKPFEPLEVQVQVFTVAGKLVWTHNQTIVTEGYLSRNITWDGRDDFGDKIGKGVYVYKITVRSTLSNKKAEKFEKLVIL